MPNYIYSALNNEGKKVSGRMYAETVNEVKTEMQTNGYFVISIKEEKGFQWDKTLNEFWGKLNSSKLDGKEIAELCKQMYIIVKSGTNLLLGLNILAKNAKNKKIKKVIEELVSEIKKGRSLSEAMKAEKVGFPDLLVNMVRVGEMSGNLEDVFTRMSKYYEKDDYVKQKIKSAMIYPIVLSVLGVGMVIVFINFVMPPILDLIKDNGSEIPMISKIVFGMIDWLKNFYYVLIILVIGIVAGFKYALKKPKVRYIYNKLLVKLPIVGSGVTSIVTSRFLRTGAMMLKSGVPILEAMEAIERITGNAVAEEGINTAIENIKRGEKMAPALESCGFFDPIIPHMILIGEETGDIDSIMEEMADFYEREAEIRLGKIVSTIPTLMTVVIGLIIGVLIVAMMLPMFNIMGGVKK